MFGRLSRLLKRAELASDLMVLEQSPDSPRAAAIRQKHLLAAMDQKVNLFVQQDIQRLGAGSTDVRNRPSNQ